MRILIALMILGCSVAQAGERSKAQDMLFALYGFKSLDPILIHVEYVDTLGAVVARRSWSFTPKIVDDCHVEVAETYEAISIDHLIKDHRSASTKVYDLTKIEGIRANVGEDWILSGAKAEAELSGLTLAASVQPTLNIYLSGPGASCTRHANGATQQCNTEEKIVFSIRDRSISRKAVYDAFNRAMKGC